MLLGFPIVGQVPYSGIFRSVLPPASKDVDVQGWVQDEGEAAVNRIVSSPPPRHASDIQALTEAEQDKQFCSPLLTRDEVDAMFGKGLWRPLERFMITQADGKCRMIDNARRTGHNLHTELVETIHTTSVDFIAAACRAVVSALQIRTVADLSGHEWMQVRVATDDLPDAYRDHPVLPEHLPFSVVAVFVQGLGWRFTVLWGLAYGLEAAVVAFNRFPLLGIAAARRCLSCMAVAYLDDELSLEFVLQATVSQLGLSLVFASMGAPPHTPKSFAPAADRHYLGTSVHTGSVALDGLVQVQPKFATVAKVKSRLDDAIADKFLSRDTAGKLRGDLIWLFSSSSSLGARYAAPLLAEHQYGDEARLSSEDVLVLQSLRAMVLCIRPRSISVLPHALPFMRVYNDASFESGILRLGWVMFPPGDAEALGGTCVEPPAVLESWKERKQQIFLGETLCALVLPMLYPTRWQAVDALWFTDNQAAVVAAVKGCSREGDVHEIAHPAAILRGRNQVRVWFEWIDSDSNPSDGLSRLGVADDWSKQQGWQLQEFAFPPAAERSRVIQALLQ